MICPTCATPLSGSPDRCPHCGALLTFSIELPAGARVLKDRYQVLRTLGQGGFGITYLAHDLQLQREVAIKELFPQGCTRQGTLVLPATLTLEELKRTREDFLREGQALARFHHPGIVRVLDTFEDNHTAYLVMEVLRGETLGEKLLRGPLKPEEALRLAILCAQALTVVHDAGLLHRDIKPENLFLEDGRVVLIDFGSIRPYQSEKTASYTRQVTPGYAAPEQYATQARFGPYTDIYALGATLYHAVTGVAPAAATDRLLGTGLAPLPAKLPPVLRTCIEQSLHLKVQDRPADARVFLGLLQGEAPRIHLPPQPEHSGEVPVPVPQPQKPSRPLSAQARKAEVASWVFMGLGFLLGFQRGGLQGALVLGALGFFFGRALWWLLPVVLPVGAFVATLNLSHEWFSSGLLRFLAGVLAAWGGAKVVKWMGR